MPTDRAVARSLADTLVTSGFALAEPLDEVSNPFRLEIIAPFTLVFMVHIRVITEAGAAHNRPPDEWHAQMIFDGDQRGQGVRNRLRLSADTYPLVLGYVDWGGVRLYMGRDPAHHRVYGYSSGLYVRAHQLDRARDEGIYVPPKRAGAETFVLMRPEMLAIYLERPSAWHSLSKQEILDLDRGVREALAVESGPLSSLRSASVSAA